eukprot:2481656-Pyramimonas_sp.AAC.1
MAAILVVVMLDIFGIIIVTILVASLLRQWALTTAEAFEALFLLFPIGVGPEVPCPCIFAI